MEPLIGPFIICSTAESPKRNPKFFNFFTKKVAILRHCDISVFPDCQFIRLTGQGQMKPLFCFKSSTTVASSILTQSSSTWCPSVARRNKSSQKGKLCSVFRNRPQMTSHTFLILSLSSF